MAAVLSRALSWSSSCICCNSRNFSLWRSEKAWEGSRNMNYWGTPVFTQKISARQLFSTTCCLYALGWILPNHTPANSPSFLYMSWDCLCISYSVQSSSPQCLPQRFSHLCLLPSAAAALFALLWWLCSSYSIPPYIPDSGLTLFKVCFYCLFLAWGFVVLAEIREKEEFLFLSSQALESGVLCWSFQAHCKILRQWIDEKFI